MPLFLIRRSAFLAHLRRLDSISPTVLPAQPFILSKPTPVYPPLKVLSPIITVIILPLPTLHPTCTVRRTDIFPRHHLPYLQVGMTIVD